MKKFITFILLFLCYKLHAQYDITPFITGLNKPVTFTVTPDGRYFITLKEGLIQAYDSSGTFIQTVYDITDSTYDGGECGMLGICIDPQYSMNHFLYVYYNHFDSAATAVQPRIRVLRLTELNNTATNPLMLLDIPELANNHVGGNIHFSNSSPDKLFITIGENTVQANAQLTNNPYGKILRINSDGTIPPDNPFYDDGNPFTGNDDRIWAYGLRNSFDFTFSPVTDSLYATENGPSQDDEINMIHAGGNYAWPVFTGYTNNPSYRDPMFTWTPTVAPTGIIYYSDTVFPQFNNHLLVAIYNNGYIYDLTLGNPPFYDTITASAVAFNFGTGITNAFISLQKGSDGCIYALHGGFVIGTLYKICPHQVGIEELPEKFYSLKEISPVPAKNHILVNYENYGDCTITLTIYDISGRLVLPQIISGSEPGSHQLTIPFDGIQDGFYFLKAEFKDQQHHVYTESKKFAVNK